MTSTIPHRGARAAAKGASIAGSDRGSAGRCAVNEDLVGRTRGTAGVVGEARSYGVRDVE